MDFKSFVSRFLSENKEPQKNPVSDYHEKRRSNRVNVRDDEHLVLHVLNPEEGDKGRTFVSRVKNVSLRGCRLSFDSTQDLHELKTGRDLIASLDVQQFSIPLHIEVVRLINDHEAAIRFKAPYPRELERLEKFLEPRCLGMSLREIRPSALQVAQSQGLRWFQGINDTHLFTWESVGRDEIVQQQLIFLECVVEWKKGSPIQTGKLKDERSTGSYGWVKSELLEFDSALNKDTLNQARILLESMSIESHVRETFIKKLNEVK